MAGDGCLVQELFHQPFLSVYYLLFSKARVGWRSRITGPEAEIVLQKVNGEAKAREEMIAIRESLETKQGSFADLLKAGIEAHVDHWCIVIHILAGNRH